MEKLDLGESSIEHCFLRGRIMNFEQQNDRFVQGNYSIFELKSDVNLGR